MRRLTVATASVAASLALAACAERDTTSPRQLSPSEASRQLIAAWPVCDSGFKSINDAAAAFFSARRDPAFSLISDMQRAFKAGDQTGATSKGLDILTRVAAARLTSAQKAGSDGGPLVTGVIACTDLRNTQPTNFDASAALAGGIFEIRQGGSTVPAFAYKAARDEAAPIDPYQGGAAPLWGIAGTWYNGPGGATDRYLVYGYPLYGDGIPVSTDVRQTGFELGRLPTTVSVAGLAVAVCASAVDAGLTTANLLQHNDSEVLLTHNASFCTGHMYANAARANPVIQRLVDLITPKVAIAQSRDEFIGGLPDGWSPFKVKNFSNSGTSLTFSQQPGNTNVYTPVHVEVTAGGTGAPVVVTLTIAGNNGDPTTLVLPDGHNGWNPVPFITAITDGGVAKFDYAYSKAGGYTLTATGSIGGTFVATGSTISNLFQIKNK